MTQPSSFTNIPQGAMVVISQNRLETRSTISAFSEGEIKFTAFGLMQFLLGAQLAEEFTSEYKGVAVSVEFLKLYVSMNNSFLKTLEQKDKTVTLFITRKELLLAKKWLEARMQHCEKEREARSEKFNADTYIGQKLLLIDIRELLIGEIVD